MKAPVDRPVDVILFGLGALGGLVIKCLKTGYPLIRIVGAVDHAPDKAGRTVADLFPDCPGGDGVTVHATLQECLATLTAPADVLYHMTESVLDRIEGQLAEAMTSGLDVISASEAMFHPALRFPDIAGRLDRVARDAGVSLTGIGINPGFSFDSLPLMLSRATSGVTRVTISRTIDVTGTGPGDIDHVGYALWPDEFDARIASGRIHGHIGMPESIAALAERLGLEIDRIDEGWETATAAFPVDSGTESLGFIEPGRVIGITQTGRGLLGTDVRISMRLVMYYDPERFGLEEADVLDIEGSHHIRASLRPAAVSLFGAANVLVNATHDIVAAAPGFVDPLDLSIAGARRGGFRYEVDPDMQLEPGRIPLRRRSL